MNRRHAMIIGWCMVTGGGICGLISVIIRHNGLGWAGFIAAILGTVMVFAMSVKPADGSSH